jgi:hypothetical protein
VRINHRLASGLFFWWRPVPLRPLSGPARGGDTPTERHCSILHLASFRELVDLAHAALSANPDRRYSRRIGLLDASACHLPPQLRPPKQRHVSHTASATSCCFSAGLFWLDLWRATNRDVLMSSANRGSTHGAERTTAAPPTGKRAENGTVDAGLRSQDHCMFSATFMVFRGSRGWGA